MESLIEDSKIDFEHCNFQEEAHFSFSNSSWLHTKPSIPEGIFLRYLDYSIRRKKNDLLSHVRKILFCQHYNRTDIIEKTIEELFSSLGDKGRQLKSSLLRSSKHLITKEEYHRLSTSINSTNIASSKNLTAKKPNKEKSIIDNKESTPTQIADSFIENGQLDEAMDHLEKHLISDINNQDLSKYLSSLYTKCNEHKRLEKFMNTLRDNGKTIPNCFNTDKHPI